MKDEITEQEKKRAKISLKDSEFVAFAMHRIWSSSGPQPHSNIKKIKLEPHFNNIIAPHGAEDWYPNFVRSVHILMENAKLSLPVVLIALIYIARVRHSIQKQTNEMAFPFFVTSVMLAQKVYSDQQYTVKSWAKITGLSPTLLKDLERQFLLDIDGKLHVKNDQYQKFILAMQSLGKEHVLGQKRKMDDACVPCY
ncbi:hypothetical protein HK103_003415 [Boothiomyces macroporosus]|uniref:Cyclin N-terminal domain-containing protein n=1 Tax=Boothiomyces macroporosus TaxID=261099 RepID=A0AAD5Y4M0_9FUNG|nr:hypothetical protein HK103_003415 [Boothiomyces macroporosus]